MKYVCSLLLILSASQSFALGAHDFSECDGLGAECQRVEISCDSDRNKAMLVLMEAERAKKAYEHIDRDLMAERLGCSEDAIWVTILPNQK